MARTALIGWSVVLIVAAIIAGIVGLVLAPEGPTWRSGLFFFAAWVLLLAGVVTTSFYIMNRKRGTVP